MIDRPIRLEQRSSAGAAPISVRSILPKSSSTLVERFLLMTAIVILPLENHIPTVAGMSVSFLIFVALAAYVIMNRPRTVGVICYHPVFIAAYAFIGVSALLEFSSPLPRYLEIIRFGEMIGGAACVAVLCRDRAGLAAGLYGYIAAALWVSVQLYLTSYGMLQDMGTADDYQEATYLRANVGVGFRINLNTLAFVCMQGAIAAFALSIADKAKHRRILLIGIACFCLVASFLSMSRGNTVGSLVSIAAILYAHGVKHGKTLILAAIVGMGLYILVPEAVWSRMTFTTAVGESGRMEARAHIYTMALNHLPEYIMAGVGAGNYHGGWALENGFVAGSSGTLIGAHNSLLQVTIYWGVLGLVVYLSIIWCIYRSIPFGSGRDGLSLAMLGIIVSLGLWLLQNHTFYMKSFAFGVGMLVGARVWIWPAGVVSAVDAQREAVR
jgi:hypothetical protein